MQQELTALVIVSFTVASVFFLGRQTHRWIRVVLEWFPAILFAYVIPAAFTHWLDLDLSRVALHDLSKHWIIPFAILTVMSALPFAQLRIVGIRPILVFAGGSCVIAVLPVILVWLFGLLDPSNHELFMGQHYWKGLVPIVGGWIGGSTSQLVLKELIGTEEALFLSVLVLDNVLVNLWTILMFQFIKRSNQLNHFFRISDSITLLSPDKIETDPMKGHYVFGIIALITIATNWWMESFLYKVILLSVTGLLLGNFIHRWNNRLVLKVGGVAIVFIMAILGLKLNFTNLSLPIPVVILSVIWILGHLAAMLFLAILLRLNIAWVAIGSMANLGGISTAPAVTSAYNKALMPHAILLAILSMVSGTGWGMFTIYLFGLL